jgi:DMSO/TMAO reductase YedYZ molybdopterin-dependent catalytic subunit
MLNGFPVRLVVAGKFGVYWTKHLTWIRALTKEDSNFWMAVPGGQERRQGAGGADENGGSVNWAFIPPMLPYRWWCRGCPGRSR